MKAFPETEPVTPPRKLTDAILARVVHDLDPPMVPMLSKVFLIHVLAGAVTLLFCPQFGLNLGGGMGLMAWFMRIGEPQCMLGCGAVFVGAGALVTSLALRPEELRKLRRHEALCFPSLSLLLMAPLICTGSGFFLGVAAFWLAGSIAGGVGLFELGWMARKKLAQQIGP